MAESYGLITIGRGEESRQIESTNGELGDAKLDEAADSELIITLFIDK